MVSALLMLKENMQCSQRIGWRYLLMSMVLMN